MGRPLNDAYFPPKRRLAQLDLWGYLKKVIMGWHVTKAGDGSLQDSCGGFDSHPVHKITKCP